MTPLRSRSRGPRKLAGEVETAWGRLELVGEPDCGGPGLGSGLGC
jgi:hypothetical protein